jgi:hypothetical protein
MESLEEHQLPAAPVIAATQRIVAEGNAQHQWKAWFEDAPEQVQKGEFAVVAVDRLLKSIPERVPEHYRIRVDAAAQADHYAEFLLTFWTEGRRDLP